MTIEQVAQEIGVTRQRISQRLIEAGYSPAATEAARRHARASSSDAYRAQRVETLREQAAKRQNACDRFDHLARSLGVKPWTLGQYVTRAGPYRKRQGNTSGRYGTGTLPPRATTEGGLIARRARHAAHPWSPSHIAQLCARRRDA